MSILDVLNTYGVAPGVTPELQRWLNLIMTVLEPVAHLKFGSGDHAPAAVELNALFPGETANGIVCWTRTDVSQVSLWINNGSSWVEGPATLPAGVGVLPGTLIPFAGTTAAAAALSPAYLVCNGAAVPRGTYADLYAVLGTSWGAGDGLTTFNLPDFRGRVPIGLDNMGGVSANRVTAAAADSIGGAGGAENHTLAAGEMPNHTHAELFWRNDDGGLLSPVYGAGYGTGVNWQWALRSNGGGEVEVGQATFPTPGLPGLTTGSAGSGGAHNNMQPYGTVNYLIKT